MPYKLKRMTRPLTGQERTRIERASRKVEQRQQDLDAATLERDLAILDAYNHRGNVQELGDAAGLSRQTIHSIVNRLAESADR